MWARSCASKIVLVSKLSHAEVLQQGGSLWRDPSRFLWRTFARFAVEPEHSGALAYSAQDHLVDAAKMWSCLQLKVQGASRKNDASRMRKSLEQSITQQYPSIRNVTRYTNTDGACQISGRVIKRLTEAAGLRIPGTYCTGHDAAMAAAKCASLPPEHPNNYLLSCQLCRRPTLWTR